MKQIFNFIFLNIAFFSCYGQDTVPSEFISIGLSSGYSQYWSQTNYDTEDLIKASPNPIFADGVRYLKADVQLKNSNGWVYTMGVGFNQVLATLSSISSSSNAKYFNSTYTSSYVFLEPGIAHYIDLPWTERSALIPQISTGIHMRTSLIESTLQSFTTAKRVPVYFTLNASLEYRIHLDRYFNLGFIGAYHQGIHKIMEQRGYYKQDGVLKRFQADYNGSSWLFGVRISVYFTRDTGEG